MAQLGETDAPGLSVAASKEGPRTVLSVSGELDLETAPRLRSLLHEAIDRGDADLVVDLSELSFLDSTGISVLVDGLKAGSRRGGGLVVRAPNAIVRRVLEITGLLELFGIPA